MNLPDYHTNLVAKAQQRAIEDAAPCPICFSPVVPDNWRKHFDAHHPGETVLPFPIKETLRVIDRETGEMTPAPFITIDNEFHALIPPLSEDERAGLETSLKTEGCRDALVIWKGHDTLIDGHNRYAICQQHNIPYSVAEKEFDSREDVIVWMVQNQLARRNINKFVRVELAERMKDAIEKRAKEQQGERTDLLLNSTKSFEPVHTRKEMARIAETSEDTVRKVEAVAATAPEPIKAAARSGELSVDRAYKLTRALTDSPTEHSARILELAGDNEEKVQILNRLYKSQGSPETNGTFDELMRTGGFHHGKDMSDWCDFTAAPVEEIQRGLRSIAEHHAAVSGAPKALQMSESNEWYTPARYIEAARKLMGGIDLDPATCEYANRIVKATQIYTIETNGLAQEWRGRIWLNPPYGRDEGESNQATWSARLLEEYRAGHVKEAVLLVNAVTDRAWFQPLWDFPICFTDHRIRFYNTEKEAGQPTHGNALIYLGKQWEAFAEAFSEFGAVVTSVVRRNAA